MKTKQNWDWVRTTYRPLTGSRVPVADEAYRVPSCIANGLSERDRRALLRVFDVACHRAVQQRGHQS